MGGFLGGNDDQLGNNGLFSDPVPAVKRKLSSVEIPGLDSIVSSENSGRIKSVMQAILGQESNGNPNIGNSVDGARGIAQMMPATFKRFAKPGESIDNPEDNLRASARYLNFLWDRSGGDPGKIAAGYFSGEGNIGTDKAYKNDYKDGNGKSVSSYVSDVLARLGGEVVPAKNKGDAAKTAGEQLAEQPADLPGWDKISARPTFQTLTPAEKDLARTEYYNRYLAPSIPAAQRGAAKALFIEQSRTADYKEPGLWDKAIDGAKSLGNKIADAFKVKEGTADESNADDAIYDPMTGVQLVASNKPTPGDLRARYGVMGDYVDKPETSKALPLDVMATPEARTQVHNYMDGATPAQRKAMEQRPGIVGLIAKERNKTYAAMDAPAIAAREKQEQLEKSSFANPKAKYYSAELNRPVDNIADTRWEARSRRYVLDGSTEANVDGRAKGDALAGRNPDYSKMTNDGFDAEAQAKFEADQKRFNENPLFANPVVRGAVKGYNGYMNGAAGINLAVAELVGADEHAGAMRNYIKRNAWQEAAMGTSGNHAQDLFEGAISSVSMQLPALIGGALTGSEALVLGSMFVQSYGQEYGEGRARGQTIAQAHTRSAQFAALEVIGEKLSLKHQMGSIKALANGDYNKAVHLVWQAAKREVPGEELTTLGQFLTDKEGGGVGLNTEAGFKEYVSQAGDTLVATLMQSGIMGGGIKAVHTASKAFDTPNKQIARAINSVELNHDMNDVRALARLDPQNHNAGTVSPIETSKTADQPLQPQQQARPADGFTEVLSESQREVDERARAAFASAPAAPVASANAQPNAVTAPAQSETTQNQPVQTPGSGQHDGHDMLAGYLEKLQSDFLGAYKTGDKETIAGLRKDLVGNLEPLVGKEKAEGFALELVDEGGFHRGTGVSSPVFNEAGNALDATTRTESKPEPVADQHHTALAIHEVPLNELHLSEDVPQFKSGSNEKGVVEPLEGKFDRTGVAPIQVWERSDGKKEIISGRHRTDLARRSGEETIPAQIHREADGFTKDHAASLDSILNIRDGQGKVKDYVSFFKNGISRQDAEAQGLLGRATGRRAYTIANDGSDTLIAAHSGETITDEAAYSIARSAPGNDRLQSLGIKALKDGKSIKDAVNLMHAVKSMTDGRTDNTGDMFGFDDSAMREAEDMAKIASRKQRDIADKVTAVANAAKNPKVAKAEGVDVKDPAAVLKRVNELRQLKDQWDNWPTNPNLVAEIRAELTPAIELKGETPAELKIKEARTEKAKAEARKEKAALEAKEKAEQEAKEIASRQEASAEHFELGQSAEDSLAGQKDIFAEPKQEEKVAEPANPKTEAVDEPVKPKTEKAAKEKRSKNQFKEVTRENLLEYVTAHPEKIDALTRASMTTRPDLLMPLKAAMEQLGYAYQRGKFVRPVTLVPENLKGIERQAAQVYEEVFKAIDPTKVNKNVDADILLSHMLDSIKNPNRYHPVVEDANAKGIKIGDEVRHANTGAVSKVVSVRNQTKGTETITEVKTISAVNYGGWANADLVDKVDQKAEQKEQRKAELGQQFDEIMAEQERKDELGAMFDDVMAELDAEEQPVKTEKQARQRRQTKTERSAGEAAKSAAINTGMSLKDAIKGLGKLFDGNVSGAGPTITPESYDRAKPFFQAAVAHLKNAGNDIRDVMRAVVKMVRDEFGADTAARMKDHVVRFVTEYEEEQKNELATSQHIEQGSGERAPAAQHVQEAIQPGSTTAKRRDTRTREGTEGSGERPGNSDAVHQSGTATDGAARNNDISESGGEFRPDRDVGESSHTEGSGRNSLEGNDALDRATEAAIAEHDAERDVEKARNFAEKLELQRQANSLPVKLADKKNIDATLPLLLDGQREDVHFAETRLAKPEGYGVLFANGTGTGKTYLSLGIVKRMVASGKTNGTIVVPNDEVKREWLMSAPNLGLALHELADTKDAGRGVAITTYANFGSNPYLLDREHHFIVADEAHTLMANADAESTKALETLRAIALHPESARQRTDMLERELVAQMQPFRTELAAMNESTTVPTDKDLARRRELERALEPLQRRYNVALEAQRTVLENVKPEERPRLVAVSATPFAWEPNIQWAQGFLFNYPKVQQTGGYNAPNAYQQYMIQHFGYRMRYGKLTRPDAKVDRTLMQVQYNMHLRKEGVLSTRMLDVDKDYDRKFVLVDGGIGARIDLAFKWLREEKGGRYAKFYSEASDNFDYLSKSRLLEAIKANAAIDMIKQHHALGRKVVVFHDFNQGGGIAPFDFKGDPSETITSKERKGLEYHEVKFKRSEFLAEFAKEFPDLIGNKMGELKSPIQTLRAAFPNALFNNGLEKKKDALNAIAAFNDDNKPEANLLVVQSAKNAGWSGHDKTGRFMRVAINLGLPTAPVKAIQLEGRIYRTGQMSDAAFRYLNTGTIFERTAFASNVSDRASTAENLAMGDYARGLKKSFIEAFESSDEYVPGEEDGKGGKAVDRNDRVMSNYDKAKSFYYGQQKKTSRNKAAEGKDYFATPEPIGYKMVEWLHPVAGEDMLEPSGGHGAIARWFPEDTRNKAVEQSAELASRLALVMDAKGVIHGSFEDHHINNKYDGIAMNPPFGTGGKLAMEHLAKAFEHLRDGGRVVAIIPEGSSMDKRFNEWLYGSKQNSRGETIAANPHAFLAGEVKLPGGAFERAGTGVATRVVIIDKNMAQKEAGHDHTQRYDLSGTKDINALFDTMEHMQMPPRVKVENSVSKQAEDYNQVATPIAGVLQYEHGRVVTDPNKAVFRKKGDMLETDAPVQKVTTAKGKELEGVFVPDGVLAKEIDKFTWKPKGQDGFFVRIRHVVRPTAGSDSTADIHRLNEKRQRGELNQTDYLAQVKDLAKGVETPELSEVRAGILAAADGGHISRQEAQMAVWFLDKNPSLADTLSLYVNHDKTQQNSGTYNNVKRMVTLFAGNTNVTTSVHEILHHAERMLPSDIRDGLVDAWRYAWEHAYQAAEGKPEIQKALDAIMRANQGLDGTHDANLKYFYDGTLKYAEHYPLLNPSEFLAVHGSDIIAKRYAVANSGWVGKLKHWLKEMVEHAKGLLGLRSDSAVLNALKSVYRADGRFTTKVMLHNVNVGAKGATTTPDIPAQKSVRDVRAALTPMAAIKSMRDGYSPYVGIEVEKLRSTPVGDSLRRIFLPASRGNGAREMAGIMRHNLAQQAHERETAMESVKEFAAMFDRLPVADSYKFIDNMERDLAQGDAKLDEAAKALRALLDKRRDDVIELGKGQLENYYENYFPHIWKQKRTASTFFSTGSMEGNADFLKQRKYEFFSDGLAAGLEPITTNPVELVLLKAREMDRYTYGQRIFAEMKQAGMVRYVRVTERAPEGYAKINDKITKVSSYLREQGGVIHRGEYWATEQVALLLNNHLSPGLTGIGIYDMWRHVGGVMNSLQLGLSAFHLGFTTMDAMVSKVSLGIKQVSRGDVLTGAANVIKGISPAQPVMNLIKGDRLLKAYLGNLEDPEMAPIVEALLQAGGRVKMDDFYRNTTTNAFKQALRTGRYGEAALKVFPRALDILNKPIFEYLVPRQKLGVFFDMAQDALTKKPNMSLQEKREVMGKLWDSVDNRLGELVYDNVFWHTALKHGLMASVRSVGWNLGTFREIGGGVKDLKDVVKDGGFSDRSAYLIALPFVAAVFGSIIQYMYIGEPPDGLKDALFPRTGKKRPDGSKDRLSLPSYIKDIYEYGHDLTGFVQYGGDPTHTLRNKMHPLLSTVGNIIENENFFGEKIRSPGDSFVQQMQDEANFLMKQMMPFGVRNYIQQNRVAKKEGSFLDFVTSPQFIGLGSAPGYVTKTAEQLESSEVARQSAGLQKKFRSEFKEADAEDKGKIVRRMYSAGLTEAQVRQVINSSGDVYAPRAPKQFGR